MQIEDVIAQLKEPVKAEALRPHWEQTLAADDGGTPVFLLPATITQNRIDSALPSEAEEPLQETARRIIANPVLRLLARHCYHLLYEFSDFSAFGSWPSFEATLGERGGVFYLLIMLAAIPRIRQTHKKIGIPEAITQATCNRCDSAERYRATHQGRWGSDRSSLYWIRHYVNGELCRIGRMEYMLRDYNGRVEVYRNTESGQTLALVPDGTCIDAQGQVVKPPAQNPGATWTATLQITNDYINGFPVSPFGLVVHQPVSLPASAWRRVLSKGDWTMDMHIPPGGGMTPEKCAESMRQGAEFFKRYFPEKPFTSITCVSWLFNTQLEEILPSKANLLLFQHELYLYPVPSTGKDGFVFIFGKDDVTPETGPRETSLQRAILDFLAAGNTWRNGGMFFLVEDLPQFGSQVYRRRWPAGSPVL